MQIKKKKISLLSKIDISLFEEIFEKTPKRCSLYKLKNSILFQQNFGSNEFSQCEFNLNWIQLDINFRKLIVDTIYKAHEIVPEIKTSEEYESQIYGVKIQGAIESEVDSLTNRYYYEDYETTSLGIIDFVSTLLHRLVKRHIFHNGNKRTALLTIAYLLNQFGFYIYSANDSSIYIKKWEKFMLEVANNDKEETLAVAEIKKVIKSKIWFKL